MQRWFCGCMYIAIIFPQTFQKVNQEDNSLSQRKLMVCKFDKDDLSTKRKTQLGFKFYKNLQRMTLICGFSCVIEIFPLLPNHRDASELSCLEYQIGWKLKVGKYFFCLSY